MKRYRIKYLKSLGKFVLHVKQSKWRRLWGYTFVTASQARKFAEGNF